MDNLRIEDLRESVYLLERMWPGRVVLEPVTATDHFYTDGLACGSSFKLTFSQTHAGSKHGACAILFVYPNLQTACLPVCGSREAETTARQWIQLATHLFGIQESRTRSLERMRFWKEDLIAAAWHPRRVERWIAHDFYGD